MLRLFAFLYKFTLFGAALATDTTLAQNLLEMLHAHLLVVHWLGSLLLGLDLELDGANFRALALEFLTKPFRISSHVNGRDSSLLIGSM